MCVKSSHVDLKAKWVLEDIIGLRKCFIIISI